jgi:hypothetical protein
LLAAAATSALFPAIDVSDVRDRPHHPTAGARVLMDADDAMFAAPLLLSMLALSMLWRRWVRGHMPVPRDMPGTVGRPSGLSQS